MTDTLIPTQHPLAVPTRIKPKHLRPDGRPNGVLISANPYSGHGKNGQMIEQLVTELTERGFDPKLVWSLKACKKALKNPKIINRATCVVAAGGDGTIATVAKLNRHDLTFVTMPMGNENLFAREFGYTKDPKQIADVIEFGRPRLIDLGKVNKKHWFSIMLSVGLDAAVVHKVTQWRESTDEEGKALKRIRSKDYVIPALDVAGDYHYPEIKVYADGEEYTGIQVLLFNIPQYGGGFIFAPDALPDDGMLDFVILKRKSVVRAVEYALKAKLGLLKPANDVIIGRARKIKIKSEEPVPIQIDGDPLGFTPAKIKAKSQALCILEHRPEIHGFNQIDPLNHSIDEQLYLRSGA